MISIRVDWREWVLNGTADGKRLEDLKEVAREAGRKMARRREQAVLDLLLTPGPRNGKESDDERRTYET